jgi:hypothetical protein
MGEAGQRIIDFDGTFFRGAKSDMDPGQLPLGYVWSALNMINLGGVLSCRPGNRCLVTLPDGNLQGAALFKPQEGLEQIVIAIDGVLYVATWPFLQFVQIQNVLLSPTAKQVFWSLTTQSAERIDNSLTSAIRVIIPKSVLIVQDGGLSAPAWYDGHQSGQIRGDPFETPSGGPMEWVGDRLWVASGNQVQASDIGNPFSFREQIYLGGASAFFFASEVTAMVKTPSIEAPQLLVFTESDGSILEANIRDRSQWPSTQNFQREVIQVGCTSNRSAFAHYGQVCWFSPDGVAIWDPATAGKLTSRLPVRDNEMMLSKTQLSDDTSLVAGASFGQFLLMSVPAEDVYNKHTWVLNHASLETLSDDSGPSWCGHWTGTRPVEWVYGEIADKNRIFHVSVDADGKNRLWESFTPDRLDNGCPITWAFQPRAHFGQTCPVPGKLPAQRCRFQWVDVGLAGVAEDLDIGVFYAGAFRGAFRQIMSKKISVEKGNLNFRILIDINSQLFGYKPQSRVIRSEDANQQDDNGSLSSCGAERPDVENIDESFELLVVGQGPATVRFLRTFALTVPEDKSGDGQACQDEASLSAVRFDGASVQGPSEEALDIALSQAPTQDFHSVVTETVIVGDFSAVGVGVAESIISQRAADRVALVIATKMAENELISVLPKTISLGLE